MTKRGRKQIPIDWNQFNKLCALQCTLQEISFFFHCSPDTIERRVKQEHKMSFESYFQEKRVEGLISLRRNLFNMSVRNPAAAIFMAKNWLGMTDALSIGSTVKHEHKHEVKIINASDIKPALEALVACGAVQVNSN